MKKSAGKWAEKDGKTMETKSNTKQKIKGGNE